jgi:hypothetical protein
MWGQTLQRVRSYEFLDLFLFGRLHEFQFLVIHVSFRHLYASTPQLTGQKGLKVIHP